MSTTKELSIVDGPSKKTLFDACEHSYDIKIAPPAFKVVSNGESRANAYLIKAFKIKSIEYVEDSKHIFGKKLKMKVELGSAQFNREAVIIFDPRTKAGTVMIPD